MTREREHRRFPGCFSSAWCWFEDRGLGGGDWLSRVCECLSSSTPGITFPPYDSSGARISARVVVPKSATPITRVALGTPSYRMTPFVMRRFVSHFRNHFHLEGRKSKAFSKRCHHRCELWTTGTALAENITTTRLVFIISASKCVVCDRPGWGTNFERSFDEFFFFLCFCFFFVILTRLGKNKA